MDNLTPLFIALTGIAVLLQAGVLVAIFVVLRQTSKRMEALATEVKTKVLPAITQAEALLTEVRPKVETIAEQVQETAIMVRNEVERVDATVHDVVDRARLQIIRADELLTRTLDRVERTSDIVQRTVVSPVRQLSGLMQGLTAGLEFFFGRGRRNGGGREGEGLCPRMRCSSRASSCHHCGQLLMTSYPQPCSALHFLRLYCCRSPTISLLTVILIFAFVPVFAQDKTVWTDEEKPIVEQ